MQLNARPKRVFFTGLHYYDDSPTIGPWDLEERDEVTESMIESENGRLNVDLEAEMSRIHSVCFHSNCQ